PMVAAALNLTRAELHGIVTFYHDFRKAPPGEHVLQLCRAEACQAMGADELAAAARRHLRIDWRQTTPDGRVTLEPVFCLGLCACAPAAMLDGKVHGGLDQGRLRALLDQARRMKPRLYISRDAGALALGADEVERAIIAAERRRGLEIEIVRTGSRGLFGLEPMIEVATPAGRVAYGPVQASDVEALFDAGLLDGKPHALRIGSPEEIPFLKRQTRLTFARCGIIDRLSIDD